MLFLFSVTIFVSSFLVFLIQPIVGKMLLPLFGGVPAVWNACLVFFQATLLGGYCYTHFSAKYLALNRQILVHGFLLCIALITLPFFASEKFAPPVGIDPAFWLLGCLIYMIGLPYFLVSSSAPLLQRWFSLCDHHTSHDPYFLYSTSNAGSLIALTSFPFLIEPTLELYEQSQLWTEGYALLLFLTLICACLIWLKNRKKIERCKGSSVIHSYEKTDKPSLSIKAFWVFTTFLPSSLMLGMTAFITTDLAATPLLWILPLILYLLTFIIVFARKRIISHDFITKLLPIVIIASSPFFFMSLRGIEILIIAIHLLTFFIVALFCHGELAKSRPEAAHLTEFYVWMSIGGMLGGVFNALVAPNVFTRVIEYPLVLILVCFLLRCSHPLRGKNQEHYRDFIFPLLLALYNVITLYIAEVVNIPHDEKLFALLFAPSAFIVFCF